MKIVFNSTEEGTFGHYLNKLFLSVNNSGTLEDWIEKMPKKVLIQYVDKFIKSKLIEENK